VAVAVAVAPPKTEMEPEMELLPPPPLQRLLLRPHRRPGAAVARLLLLDGRLPQRLRQRRHRQVPRRPRPSQQQLPRRPRPSQLLLPPQEGPRPSQAEYRTPWP